MIEHVCFERGSTTSKLHASRIGRHHDELIAGGQSLSEVGNEVSGGVEVVDRNVEKALNLTRVKVHGEHPVHS